MNLIQYYYDINKVESTDLDNWFISYIKKHNRDLLYSANTLVELSKEKNCNITIKLDDKFNIYLTLTIFGKCEARRIYKYDKIPGIGKSFMSMLISLKKIISIIE